METDAMPDQILTPPDAAIIDPMIEAALREDVGAGDITTEAIAIDTSPCRAIIFAKANGMLAGVEIACRVFELLDPHSELETLLQDGAPLQSGDHVLRITGPTSVVLTGERTALNFMAHLSGIASVTGQYVQAVAGTKARILDTRKTTPGLRLLEKYAVTCGGGMNHRIGLHDMYLIKDNHIDQTGSLPQAVERILAHREQNNSDALIEVEAETLEQVHQAVELPVDRILVDNMTPAQLAEAVVIAGGRVPLEASGGISLDNVRDCAESGVDYISIGALTHSAPAFDFSLRLEDTLI
jgi:nicotinate-nucleotide pyrophosphorylase (carboxylating)